MTEQMQEAKATPAAQKAKAKSHPSNTIQTSSEIISVDEPENALPEVSLADLPQLLQTACAKAGWNSLMPVQSRALPYLLEGRDLMVQSRTGSGKTGTYLLPLMARLNPAMPAVQAVSYTHLFRHHSRILVFRILASDKNDVIGLIVHRSCAHIVSVRMKA